VINLLVLAPIDDAQVIHPVDRVALDAMLVFEFRQPIGEKNPRLGVAGVKAAREGRWMSEDPPGIVGNQPELDEGKPRHAAHRAHAAGKHEVRFDHAGACHGASWKGFPI
jgi:hypothetical protein